MDIKLEENGIYLHIHITEDKDVRFYHCASWQLKEIPKETKMYRLVEVHESGMNQNDHHGNKHTGSSPGSELKYVSHDLVRNQYGLKLSIKQEYNGLLVISNLQFYNNISVLRSWTNIINLGKENRPLEYISSFALTGLTGGAKDLRDKNSKLYIPHNTWYGEAQWKDYTLNELGYDVVNVFSVKRINCTNTGSWASGEYLPMGAYSNNTNKNTILWQIETHGSWHWEISDVSQELYLQLSGPTYQENGFFINLKPGDEFKSVDVALSFVQGDFQKAIQEMTLYRRVIRRPNNDNLNPSVIFNDYMNCLSGDPTTEKLIPLINTAAETGCKYFCIDAGWYDDGPWWDGVGEWLPSEKRFPNGLQEPLNLITSLGMIPGLWLELEVMGINCSLVKKVPKEWFFQRNGKAVIDEGRYQLDYRNKEVQQYASQIIKRLVEEYKVGYIKMDYNINAGIGTELNSDSTGAGLLAHTRAYLSWLDEQFLIYPDLVIENCSSGGMRMTYSLLSRQSIQSVSDQTDYIKNAVIAANCPTAVTPEQAAIWSYPLKDGDIEETVFNMVNTMLLRVHMSGHISTLSDERLLLVKEGIRLHQSIVKKISNGVPIWPLGLAKMDDDFIAMGINCDDIIYLAIWLLKEDHNSISIPLVEIGENIKNVSVFYPTSIVTEYSINDDSELYIELKSRTARIFKIELY